MVKEISTPAQRQEQERAGQRASARHVLQRILRRREAQRKKAPNWCPPAAEQCVDSRAQYLPNPFPADWRRSILARVLRQDQIKTATTLTIWISPGYISSFCSRVGFFLVHLCTFSVALPREVAAGVCKMYYWLVLKGSVPGAVESATALSKRLPGPPTPPP